jgi:hypothetical protein
MKDELETAGFINSYILFQSRLPKNHEDDYCKVVIFMCIYA